MLLTRLRLGFGVDDLESVVVVTCWPTLVRLVHTRKYCPRDGIDGDVSTLATSHILGLAAVDDKVAVFGDDEPSPRCSLSGDEVVRLALCKDTLDLESERDVDESRVEERRDEAHPLEAGTARTHAGRGVVERRDVADHLVEPTELRSRLMTRRRS